MEALTRQLEADPADYVTRMAYADWLEENGQDQQAVVQRTLANHTQSNGLEAYVEANPEDFLARTVYAAWLEQNGEADQANMQRNLASHARGTYQRALARFTTYAPQEAEPLARAVAWGYMMDVETEWENDQDCQHEEEYEECLTLCVSLDDEDGDDLMECLGGITDPDQNYGFYLEAELTSELMRQWRLRRT